MRWIALALCACSGPAMVDAGMDTNDGGRDAGRSVDGGPELDAGRGIPPPGDTCADAIDANDVGLVGADGSLSVHATNENANTDLNGCTDRPGVVQRPDIVVRYTATATGGLRFTIDPDATTRMIGDVRTICDDPSTNVFCDDCSLSCNDELEVSEGDELFFVVSGVLTTGSPDGYGEVDMTFLLLPDPALGDPCDPNSRPCPAGSECQEPETGAAICGVRACGDGYLGYTFTECEDGNTTPGDGCDSTCMVDRQGAGAETCAAPTELQLPRVRGISLGGEVPPVHRMALAGGAFTGLTDVVPTCAFVGGPDAIYTFTLDAPAAVEIEASNTDVLSLRRGTLACGEDFGACDMGDPSTARMLTFGSLAAGTYTIVLSRIAPATGDYSVSVLVDPPA